MVFFQADDQSSGRFFLRPRVEVHYNENVGLYIILLIYICWNRIFMCIYNYIHSIKDTVCLFVCNSLHIYTGYRQFYIDYICTCIF